MRRLNDASWDSLIGRIYDAAVDDGAWEDVLVDIGKPMKAHAMQFTSLYVDAQSMLSSTVSGFENPERANDEYQEMLSRGLHVRSQHGAQAYELAVLFDYQHTSERDMKTSLFYQEHLKPLGVPYYAGLILKSSPETFTAAVFFRSAKVGHVDESEVHYLNRLAPHLRRALEIRQKLGAKAFVSGCETLLQHFHCGAILLDRQGHVVSMNDSASAMLAAGDGLTIRDRRLMVRDPSAQLALNNELGKVLTCESVADIRGNGIIRAPRPSGRFPWQLVVSQLPYRYDIAPARFALVMIVDPEATLPVPIAAVKSAFGLTEAEAQVAASLTTGKTVAEIAHQRLRSIETVRTQVKSILKKAGARDKTDLVARLMTLATLKDG